MTDKEMEVESETCDATNPRLLLMSYLNESLKTHFHGLASTEAISQPGIS